MIPRDPFRRAAWYGWGILAVLAILIPYGCTVSQANAPAASPPASIEQRADGASKPEDVRCLNGWCMVKQDTLMQIVTALQKLNAYTAELNKLCGWKDK